MTLKERLEKKVSDFCQRHNWPLIESSLGYTGLCERAFPPSNELKAYHRIAFNISGLTESTWQRCSIYIDPATEKIVFLLTPQWYEVLDE